MRGCVCMWNVGLWLYVINIEHVKWKASWCQRLVYASNTIYAFRPKVLHRAHVHPSHPLIFSLPLSLHYAWNTKCIVYSSCRFHLHRWGTPYIIKLPNYIHSPRPFVLLLSLPLFHPNIQQKNINSLHNLHHRTKYTWPTAAQVLRVTRPSYCHPTAPPATPGEHPPNNNPH